MRARYSLKRHIPYTTARHSFSMIRYLVHLLGLTSCWHSLLDTTFLRSPVTVQLLLKLQMHVLRTNSFLRSGSFNTGSGSRYSLSSEYARSCASFHCICSDLPFLRRLDSGAEVSVKAGMKN